MSIEEEVQNLLREIGPGKMSNTAYDAAWIARLGEINWDLSSKALNWLCEHQLSDGSWGTKKPFYYHDRVISTLAAMIALTYRGRRAKDKIQIEKGLLALERITSGATKGLAAAPNGATVGFEMIVPTLVAEAEKLGIIKQQGDRILGRLRKMRDLKMSKLTGLKISRHITPAFSSEMAGSDHINLLDINDLQEINGSVANSPAATAHFANFVRPSDPKAISYLEDIVQDDGGTPFASPFDIFERTWVLWNLALANLLDQESEYLFKPHLNHLLSQWDDKFGTSFSETYTPKDGDDTSLTYSILYRFNQPVNINTVLNYEEEDAFRCYPLESNSSISVNIHVLDALKNAGFDKNYPAVQKIINYLSNNRVDDSFWLDKWHTSPFYPTSHFILAAYDYDSSMCAQAIDWILDSQKADGSWGFSDNTSTAEETAYCIQALKLWDTKVSRISKARIDLAASWLEDNISSPYPSLWIGKVLYCPEYVVKSAVLSAIELSRQ
ncbi:MAG: prenyltransferase/squalene oxidase repeat-containing protein [Anaerolineales bacterium]